MYSCRHIIGNSLTDSHVIKISIYTAQYLKILLLEITVKDVLNSNTHNVGQFDSLHPCLRLNCLSGT